MEKIWGTVLPAEKIRRSEKISLLGRSKYKRFIGRFGNRTVNALFLTSYDKGYQDALSDNQLPVKVKTKKIILPGTIKKVSIASEIKSGLTAAIV
jgi:asparagine synthetase A